MRKSITEGGFMATSVKYNENRKELILCGVGREQEKNLRAIMKLVVNNLAESIPAEHVQKQIKKRVPLAGTAAGALRAYRLREELTQEQLAKKTKIAQGHISSMEMGRRAIGIKSAKTLAKALNCRWERLLSA
jgi:DNA-binding XRE family transcriptional regulator